jgi:hypothetical protein
MNFLLFLNGIFVGLIIPLVFQVAKKVIFLYAIKELRRMAISKDDISLADELEECKEYVKEMK